MNMAYCRFQNTTRNLRDCQEHLLDRELSAEEEAARKELVEICRQIVKDADEEGL